jgi:hypothetical protein
MGLDFRVVGVEMPWEERVTWSYGGFNRFRERIAASVGIDWDALFRTRDFAPLMALADPIQPLLNHSDCEGDLSASECRKVAPRLREIIAAWPQDDYDRIHGEKLAAMMQRAADRNVPLIFC